MNAEPLTRSEDIQREMVSQVVAPVRWIATIEQMASMGISTFVEIGPGKVLTGLIKRIMPEAQLINVSTAVEVQAFARGNL